jgi:phosphoribosylamine--glycine ligase
MKKQVLVVGSGGREHALGYGLDLSPLVGKIYFAPGNAGTARLTKGCNIKLQQADMAEFCLEHKVDLVVIGPDAPIVAGLADDLRANGIAVFGPSKAAAQLEGSKAFATEFMQAHNIPLPPAKVVLDEASALAAIESFGGYDKVAIKADGLASGKGVFLPDSAAEAEQAVKSIISGTVDNQGDKLVIQQRYHGPEVSIFVLSDGDHFSVIPIASQDHKRLLAGDKGPMTGGMGAYAPLPDWMLSDGQWKKITDIAEKTISGMHEQGTPYRGVLYLGLMLAEETGGDPVIIEYNARFGDPETEILVPLMIQNGIDLYSVLAATANGSLSDHTLPANFHGAALTICLAAAGYPKQPQVNEAIHGVDKIYKNAVLFHGNTSEVDGNLVNSGGRVVFVTGVGSNLEAASSAANAAIGTKGIHFEGMQYRSDIGHRAFQK